MGAGTSKEAGKMDLLRKQYPVYMYHKDEDEPVRCDNKTQEDEYRVKGWVNYLWKQFPTRVTHPETGAKQICKNQSEKDSFLGIVPDAPELSVFALKKMNKDEIVIYGMGLNLDLDPGKQTKAEMIAMIMADGESNDSA